MVDELFARQSEWTNSVTSAEAQAVFEDIAGNTLGLDVAQFNTDMADPVLTDRINRDITDAGALGVTGTPTYFLNGTLSATTPTNAEVQAAAQAAAGTFSLNRLTGELRVVDDTAMDFETNPTFSLNVSAVNGASEVLPVTVNLIDTFGQ